MKKFNFLLFIAFAISTVFTGCKKDDDDEIELPAEETKVAVRTSVNYSSLTATTEYNNEFFVDQYGDSTVDRLAGQYRYLMFKALNAMGGSGTTTVLSSSVLKSMYENQGNPFSGIYANLNSTGLQLRNVTASSYAYADAEKVRTSVESFLDSLAKASTSYATTADDGVAGVIKNNAQTSKYLVDGKGIEWNQIVQKSLIGAFQIDYIGNVLLNKGLQAENYSLVLGRNYTQLEHNWDEAFGVLTLNNIYGIGGSVSVKPTAESFIGSYVWEYNKTGFTTLHEDFLKGRGAIINNDATTYKAKSDIIRTSMELAIANASLGYLQKWKDNMALGTPDNGAAAHALGEGLGFIYSLRFCKMHGADAAFSDDIFEDIMAVGHWGMTPAIADAAAQKIKAKFKI